jgi:hypothetical protein
MPAPKAIATFMALAYLRDNTAQGERGMATTKAKKATRATSSAKAKRPAKATAAKGTPARTATKTGGDGTKARPWKLRTPPGTSEYQMYRADDANPPAIVCVVGATELRYHASAIEDLHAMLKRHGDWMPLGSADEQKPAVEGTVEAWGRSPKNPVKGWYGLKKGLRGRFGMYMPPLLEALGLAEVTHDAKNNRMRAI